MNFTEFKKSDFYKKGKIRYSLSERTFIHVNACSYLTESFDFPTTEENVKEITAYSLERDLITLLHLKKSLQINNFMPMEFRIEIARQWVEVNKCIADLNRTDKSYESFLIIQEPGKYISTHNHNHETNHSITFCYTFEDDAIVSDKLNACTVYQQDKIKIDKVMKYPDSGKFYLEIIDNKPHDSHSDKWRFFWLNDFMEYKETPNSIRDWQKIS